ncbi:ankyrin [Wolfiporia cocos MD-104 SS10]|uniref:Ankyrin n=1 Tax=Wolfiporia cocos (strain MD-104) TaxID=742152 RepID=A0A2H3JD90_WOLCO|nr:ankyrin [Wolfiporia cocos MD-104 SS10]
MPPAPEAHAFLARIAELPPSGPDVFDALSQALQPSLDDEAELRKLFATDKNNPRLQDPHVGLVDVFDAPADIRTTRARVVKDEQDVNAKFVLPLTNERRHKDGAPAMVSSLDEFKKNWAIFTEGSLSQLLDWNNVIAAGGSVQACLNPVPASAKVSKRAMRKHFHNNAYPTSDVDLFLYGLTPEQAEVKINAIYEAVRDSVPWDVTCIRTKHTVSIHSQYPYRAVQIVLRLYNSPAEILAGFDVDAPCCAYDGERVWANPRAIVAMMRQCNTVDMTRRSPSYEVRLVKYSARDFEVYAPSLRREDIDPTIFERSIARIQGLARLLVLERLTTANARDKYLSCRRTLRGRPQSHNAYRRMKKKYKGDLKAGIDFAGLEMNDYDVVSLHIPYGPGWDARRIEKLVYQTDLGMNSPFNPKNKDRRLHRHPAFFGTMKECLEDCCEYCPDPKDEEERKLQEEEDKAYLRGRISFIEEDPGRQSISGSFNPIDVGEWAEQAYMGPTEKLFAAIVARDREAVARLIKQEDTDVNRRDHVGRTPLQMAIMVKAIDISCDLVDADARMTARVADGRTALHLAAQLDLPEVVRKLLDRSALNEEKAKKAEEEAKAKVKEDAENSKMDVDDEEHDDDEHNSSEDDWKSDGDADDGAKKNIEGKNINDSMIPEDEGEPDIINVNAPDWDLAFTPLQYAIVFGSAAVVDQLIAAGADVGLLTKADGYDTHTFHQLTVTALAENEEAVREIAKKLFAAGAVSSQADDELFTIFHRIVCAGKSDLAHTFLHHDSNAKAVVNIPFMHHWNPVIYPVVSAIAKKSYSMVALLLAYGAKLVITEEDYTRVLATSTSTTIDRSASYQEKVCMPLEAAIAARDDVVTLLVAMGAEVNLPSKMASRARRYRWQSECCVTLLEWTRFTIRALEDRLQKLSADVQSETLDEKVQALASQPGWKGETGKVLLMRREKEKKEKESNEAKAKAETEKTRRKLQATKEYFSMVESQLVSNGAKTWNETFPDDNHEVKNLYSDNSRLPTRTTSGTGACYSYHVFTGQWSSFPAPAYSVPRYDELFEACWNGDNAKIEQLCLPKNGSESNKAPLQIAVQLEDGGFNDAVCNPLSISIARRHWDTARLVLAIASAQYEPEKSKATKFQMRGIVLDNEDEEEEEEDDDDDNMDDDSVPINFVDIAKRPSTVKTSVSPQTLLNHGCIQWIDSTETLQRGSVLFRAIFEDDLQAFVQIAELYSSLPEPEPLPTNTLFWTLKYDRRDVLDELIRRSGVGIDVDNENAHEDEVPGATHQKSSKIYLGLNVYGKKRKDLATKNDPNANRQAVQNRNLPLLWDAAKAGALRVIAYLEGDLPLAAYRYYASTHSDERATYLRRAPDLASVLPQWLGWSMNQLNESAITTAILGDNLVVLKELLTMQPKEMEQALIAKIKFAEYNHISVAAASGVAPEIFDYLLDKGISPIELDHRGWNILHILCAQSGQNHARLLHHVLHKLPQDSIERMLHQQSKLNRNTPLHIAVKRSRVDLVRMLVDTKVAPFLFRDSEGSTPLHIAIKRQAASMSELLADAGPVDALYMEDGVGYTPLETTVQNDLLQRTRSGFRGIIQTPDELSNTLDHFADRPFNLAHQSVEIPQLRATVEALLKVGRLHAGTKVATELVKFTELMEARLEREKNAAAEAEARGEKPDTSSDQPARMLLGQWHQEDDTESEFKSEWDHGNRPQDTLKAIEKALAARPFAQMRVLVHLSDVHASVKRSLDESTKTYERVHQGRDDVLEQEMVETVEDKAKQCSALQLCIAGGINHFGLDDI